MTINVFFSHGDHCFISISEVSSDEMFNTFPTVYYTIPLHSSLDCHHSTVPDTLSHLASWCWT